MTFKINTNLIPALQERIVEANKKADKLGVPHLTLSLGDTSIHQDSPKSHKVRRTEVAITGETPKFAGWAFVASLELTNNGAIIRTIPGQEVPADQRDRGNQCDHCHINQPRKHTYILRNDNGQVVTVGRQCLQDFMGSHRFSPTGIAQWFSYVDGLIREVSENWCGASAEQEFELPVVLSLTGGAINVGGWVSRSMIQQGKHDGPATSQVVAWALYPQSDKDRQDSAAIFEAATSEEEAQEAIAWILAQDSTSDYIHTCQTIAKTGFVTVKNFGFACSILPTYRNAMGRELAKAQEKKQLAASEYVGQIKTRQEMTVNVSDIKVLDSQFGVTHLHIMTDDHGNSIKWFGSRSLGTGTHRVKATVKDHREYNGIKETIVTRVAEVA